jgi:hypothetical protein
MTKRLHPTTRQGSFRDRPVLATSSQQVKKRAHAKDTFGDAARLRRLQLRETDGHNSNEDSTDAKRRRICSTLKGTELRHFRNFHLPDFSISRPDGLALFLDLTQGYCDDSRHGAVCHFTFLIHTRQYINTLDRQIGTRIDHFHALNDSLLILDFFQLSCPRDIRSF